MGEFFSEGGDQVSLVTRRERSVETTVELSTMSGRAEGGRDSYFLAQLRGKGHRHRDTQRRHTHTHTLHNEGKGL